MQAFISSLLGKNKTEKRQSIAMQAFSTVVSDSTNALPETTDPLLHEMGAMRDERRQRAKRSSLPLDNLSEYTSLLTEEPKACRRRSSELPLDNLDEDLHLLGELKSCDRREGNRTQQHKYSEQEVGMYYHIPHWQTSNDDKTLLLRIDWSTLLEIMEEITTVLFERHEVRYQSRLDAKSSRSRTVDPFAEMERRDDAFLHVKGAVEGRTNQLVRAGYEPFFSVDGKGKVVKYRVGGEGRAIEKITWLKAEELVQLGDEWPTFAEDVGLGISYGGKNAHSTEKQRRHSKRDDLDHAGSSMISRSGATVILSRKKVRFDPEVEVNILVDYRAPTSPPEVFAGEELDFERMLMGDMGSMADLSYVSAESVGQLSPKLPREL